MKKFTFALASILVIGVAQQGASQETMVKAGISVHDLFGMEAREALPGVKARGVGAATIRLARIEVATGFSTPSHNHPDEEIVLVLEGRIKATSGGQEFILGPGELMVIPAYVAHSYQALESSVTIEAFGPGRRDFDASSSGGTTTR